MWEKKHTHKPKTSFIHISLLFSSERERERETVRAGCRSISIHAQRSIDRSIHLSIFLLLLLLLLLLIRFDRVLIEPFSDSIIVFLFIVCVSEEIFPKVLTKIQTKQRRNGERLIQRNKNLTEFLSLINHAEA